MEHDTRQVRLQLHNHQHVYSITESVRPQLQILNGTDRPLIFGRDFVFDWEVLFFAPPNAVHLIDPASRDLALPYMDGSRVPHDKPLVVAPGKEEWLFLPISAFLHLRALGMYRFWVELVDGSGELHKSNVIDFELVDVEQSFQPDEAALNLSTRQSPWPVTGPVFVDAAFTNRTSRPMMILKPQEDSFYGWVNPIYQFTVLDEAGRSLPLALRSGTMAEPRYDDSTRVTVAPGSSAEQSLRLPDLPRMRHPGQYRVSLTYVVRRWVIGKGGAVLSTPANWPPETFVGRLESPEVTVTLR